MQVQTNPFVFLADADFVPSGTAGELYRYLSQDSQNSLGRLRQKWEQRGEREVLIIPAFERLRVNLHEDPKNSPCYLENPTCWVYEKMDVPYTKQKLVKMVHDRDIEPFYMTRVCSNIVFLDTTLERNNIVILSPSAQDD